MITPILSIKNFTQKYNDFIAVDDLSLSVNPGEMYGFIGHNGAGKSTTIKSIAGILPVEQGEIMIDGHSIITERKHCQSIIAYVADNPDIYGYMTGIDYINFIANIYKVPEKLRKERCRKFADAFEITEYLGDLISSYSHGMKQKVALIAAFVHEPKLLILDEPFVGLDPLASSVLKRLMREHCETGNAVLFSTHVLEVAQSLCDKIAMLNHGHLLIEGDVHELTKDSSLEELFLKKVGNEHA